jgi:hypothetical protein
VLAKGPYPPRSGERYDADWYRTVIIAAGVKRSLEAKDQNAEILILCDAQYEGGRPEADYYVEALNEQLEYAPRVIIYGHDTVTQLEWALRIARAEKKELIVVAAWIHAWRARWILRGTGTHICAVNGKGHPQYVRWDIILLFLYPFIELIGLKNAFLAYGERKRKGGVAY